MNTGPGVGYARTITLCYLLNTEEDLADSGPKFQGKLLLVRKDAFRNAKASQVFIFFFGDINQL